MRHAQRVGARRSGFTLVELMVVLVLMAILAALVIPEMKGTFDDAVLRSTARKLADVFLVANSHAVTANRVQRVRIDAGGRRYSIEQAAGARDPQRGSDAGLSDTAGEIDERVRVAVLKQDDGDEAGKSSPRDASREPAERGDAISFYPDGTADAREVMLRDRHGYRLLLQINPITARVHVIELERE